MQQFSGTKMVVTECGVIFNNLNPTLSLYTPLVANIVQLAAVFFSVPVLSRYGRKNPTLIG
jgi:SP family sugar:H+ symporter-like MFS transporter